MAPKKDNVASIPVMITRAMEADLKARGHSQEAINQMTPQEAHAMLVETKSEEELKSEEQTFVVYDGPLPHVAIHVGRTSTVSLCRGVPARIDAAIAEDLITRKKVRAATREEIAAAK